MIIGMSMISECLTLHGSGRDLIITPLFYYYYIDTQMPCGSFHAMTF